MSLSCEDKWDGTKFLSDLANHTAMIFLLGPSHVLSLHIQKSVIRPSHMHIFLSFSKFWPVQEKHRFRPSNVYHSKSAWQAHCLKQKQTLAMKIRQKYQSTQTTQCHI